MVDTSVLLTRLIVVKVPDVGSLQRSIVLVLQTSVHRHVLECLDIVVDSPGERFSVQVSFEIILKYPENFYTDDNQHKVHTLPSDESNFCVIFKLYHVLRTTHLEFAQVFPFESI